MKHTNLDEWKKAVTERDYTVKQTQGYEHFEALDGDRVVGTWVADHGHLDDPEPETESPLVDESGEPLNADPSVPENNVTEVQS
jgi:hypothetical protein